jgi:hypothetical protein
LFDSGKRDCDEMVGPAQPTFEECTATTITTTPTTTTTTKPTTTRPGIMS